LLPLLGVLCLGILLFVSNRSNFAEPRLIPVNLHSVLEANYEVDVEITPLPGVDFGIIWDTIHDRAPGVTDLDQRRVALLNSLLTPVPTVTPILQTCQGIRFVYASQDTWIDSANSTVVYGTETRLQVGRRGDQVKNIFLYFPINDTIPQNTYIYSARLEMDVEQTTGLVPLGALNFLSLAEPFGELNSTWSNQPRSNIQYYIRDLATENIHVWDVTEIIRDWLSGRIQNNGLVIAPPTSDDFTFSYYSREIINAVHQEFKTIAIPVGPRLVINCGGDLPQAVAVNLATPTPTLTRIKPTSTQEISNPIATNTPPATPLPTLSTPPTSVASPTLPGVVLPTSTPVAPSPTLNPIPPSPTATQAPPIPPLNPPPGGSDGDPPDDTPSNTPTPLPPSLTINDVAIVEGNAGTVQAVLTVSLSAPTNKVVSVSYATLNNSATVNDYVATSGILTFPAGSTSQTLSVFIQGDLLDELDESFFVMLSNASQANIADNQGRVTIMDDDPPPSLSIDDVIVTEGNAGVVDAVFTVNLSAASGLSVTVDYATADGTATTPGDYTATGLTTLTFAPGMTSQMVTVTVQGDTLDELNEIFLVNLSSPTNAIIVDGQGVGTIIDDDSATVCYTPVITLTATADSYILIDNPNDNNGTKTMLETKPDSSNPRRSLIQFDLGAIPVNSFITCASLLLDQVTTSDNTQTVSIHRVTNSWLEGNGSTTGVTWNDRDVAGSGIPWTSPGGDYDLTAIASFAPDIIGERVINTSSLTQFWLANPGLNFGLLLRSTTTGNVGVVQYASREDGANLPPRLVVEYIPGLTINDVAVAEGDSGTTTAIFNVALSSTAAQTVTVAFTTADNTAAVTDNDYVAASGMLVFPPGITLQTVSVTVNGDTNVEGDENFFVNLSSPANAGIADGQGIGLILQDITGFAWPPEVGHGSNRIFLPLIMR
jgi:hypothetical protein